MFFLYMIAITCAVAIISRTLVNTDAIWRWWVIGQLIRSDNRRHATAPRLKHLKYMR